MRFLANIALRNLFRNKLRTIVAIVAIAVSVLVVVFTRGLIGGFIESSFSLYVHYDTGHIKIVNEEYKQKERLLSLAYPVDGFANTGLAEMKQEINELENIEMVIPRIKFGATVSTEDELVQMMGWGVNPQKEIAFTNVEKEIVEGRMVESAKREVVMGTVLLNKLQKKVGEDVTILYNTSFNSFKGATFKIVGRIESALGLLNEQVFYTPLDVAQHLLYMDDQATELLLVTNNLEQSAQIVPEVNELLEQRGVGDKYVVNAWNEGSAFIQMMLVASDIYNFIYIFLVILSAFVVINTLVMIVKERTQEIGMMAALGLKSKDILSLFLLEGAAMAVTGSFLGAVGGGLINYYLAQIGIDYSAAMETMGQDILVNPIIYPSFEAEHMIYAFVLGVIVTTLTSIIPARRAAKLNPTEALRQI